MICSDESKELWQFVRREMRQRDAVHEAMDIASKQYADPEMAVLLSEIEESMNATFEVLLPMQVALFALCHGEVGGQKSTRRAPNADQALSLLLQFKSQNGSSVEIFEHRRSLSQRNGRRTKESTSGAIHAVVRHCQSGDAKWLLLFEIMLREGACTASLERVKGRGGYSGATNTQTVLDQVIQKKNTTLCDLMFEHAVDINSSVHVQCEDEWVGDYDAYVRFVITAAGTDMICVTDQPRRGRPFTQRSSRRTAI